MPTRDYYVVLGVPRTDSVAAIRSACRDRAKRLHADQGGGDESAFRELREAYQVLADSERRRRYDEAFGPTPRRRADWDADRATAEPMVGDVVSIFGDVASARPSYDELYDRFRRNFTGLGVPKGERAQALDFELVLTPGEAQRGGVLPFDLPAVAECPRCRGSGQEWLFHCRACRGTGLVEQRRVMRLRLPAGMRPGTILETSLAGYGIDNLYLRLRVRIGA